MDGQALIIKPDQEELSSWRLIGQATWRFKADVAARRSSQSVDRWYLYLFGRDIFLSQPTSSGEYVLLGSFFFLG